MPRNTTLNLPTTTPKTIDIPLTSWRKGVITLVDKSNIPKDALIEAQNLFLVEDGVPSPRPGTDWYGTAPSASAIDGATLYYTAAGAPHLICVSGGTVYRSLDDGTTWNTCTGTTLVSGKKCFFVQDGGYLYITNKQDNIIRYDGSTTLVTYTSLSSPAAPTIVETGSGLTAGSNYHHYWKISAVNAVGFTPAGTNSTVIDTAIDRTAWSYTGGNYATLTWSAVTGALRYDIYYSNDNIDFYYVDTTIGNASTNYVDDGSAPINTNVLAPVDNTTQGPIVQRLEQVGARLWAVEDLNNPARIWFSGDGAYSGYFSVGYNGGYIDLMKGSQFRPVRVVDYRDGKGVPYATVWFKSPDGKGCIWQITLEEISAGDVTILVPSALRLPGSRGTDAPESVINVLNDYLFFNSQAFYNLGSRAQFLNLLSTDEDSANIRPSVKQINAVAASGIASIYFDAKVYWSVPVGSTSNNRTMVYDTERKAWLPEAFTIGFERFFQYVDTSGNRKLLAWKTGDTKLTQIDSNIKGDYGVAFSTSLLTGLYPVSQNRFGFMRVQEVEVEFSQPSDTINVELIGIERSKGYASQKSETITSTTTLSGWSSKAWSTTAWSDTSDAASTFSESSVKRYFTVQKELNAFQWHVFTNTLSAKYLLRTLQINGRATNAGKPRTWLLR